MNQKKRRSTVALEQTGLLYSIDKSFKIVFGNISVLQTSQLITEVRVARKSNTQILMTFAAEIWKFYQPNSIAWRLKKNHVPCLQWIFKSIDINLLYAPFLM